MPYRLQPAKNFRKHYSHLTFQEQQKVDDKLRILAKNLWHPSLRTKRIQGTDELEVSVNMDIRMAVAFEDGRIIMLGIDHYDRLLERRSAR